MTFERYRIYELRKDVPLSFQFVLALSTTVDEHRHGVTTVTFAPVIKGNSRSNNDPHRIPIEAKSNGGSARILSRMYAVVNAIQSIDKAAFLPIDHGPVTPVEEQETRRKLAAWLGM
ncbi:hypothetical protein GGR28_001917 [Lewinella aquimaris]|uniref:Uncharacterized protein n=1 Tax=Neolewinella aquimaris TaxID=1835722 RepID=A0A840E7Q4_9BACT|nr:hypothetical protein [Neolewinella aquimaris]